MSSLTMFGGLRVSFPALTTTGPGERELPLVVGVLADLGSAVETPLSARQFRDIDHDTFAAAMRDVSPRVILKSAREPASNIEIRFRGMDDFDESDAIRAQLDAAGLTLDALHASEAFHKLEATWRGVDYLVNTTQPSQSVRVRLLDVTYAMMRRDLDRAPSVEQSYLFKLLHDNVYGIEAGEPFGVLVTDIAFGERATDNGNADQSIRVLDQLTRIAAAIHAPLVAAPHPHMLGVQDFAMLDTLSWKEIGRRVDDATSASLKTFQESEHARYACLVLPRVLFNIHPVSKRQSWGSAAFVAATRIINSFNDVGWNSRIIGDRSGGNATDLVMFKSTDSTGATVQTGSTDTALDDLQEHALSMRGLACLMREKDSAGACFWSMPTFHVEASAEHAIAPRRLNRVDQLSHVLAVSHFAHYLRMMALTAPVNSLPMQEREQVMNNWLQRYVSLTSDELPIEAARPLLEARVELSAHSRNTNADVAALTGIAYLRVNAQLLADDSAPFALNLGFCGSTKVVNAHANSVHGPDGLVAWIESRDDVAHLHVARGNETVLTRSLARTDTLDYGYEGCSVEHMSWCDQHVVIVTQERNSRFVTCINPMLGDDEFLALSHECAVERDLLVWVDDNPGLLCTASLPSLHARPPIPMRGARPSGHIHLVSHAGSSPNGLQHCVHAELMRHAGGGTIDMLTLPSDRQRLEYQPVSNLVDLIEQRLYPNGGVIAGARFVVEAIAHPFVRGAPQTKVRAAWAPSPVWMPVYWLQHLMSREMAGEAMRFVQLLDAIGAHFPDNEPEYGWNMQWSNHDAQVELATRYVCRTARTMARVCRTGVMPDGWWSLLFDPAPGSTVAGSRVDVSLYPPALRAVFEQLAVTNPGQLSARVAGRAM